MTNQKESFQEYLDRALKKVNLDESKPDVMEDYDIGQEVSDMIVAARLDADLTQIELSKLSGVTQPRISDFETGVRIPTLRVLRKLADGLNKRLVVMFVDKEDDV